MTSKLPRVVRRFRPRQAAPDPEHGEVVVVPAEERAPSGLILRDAPQMTIKRRDPAAADAFLRQFASRIQASHGSEEAEVVIGDGSPATVTASTVHALDWYHTITLPDGTVTRGMFDHRDLVPHYGIPDDLSGQRVLDIATSNGFWAFEFERRGGEVTATDISPLEWDWPTNARPGVPPHEVHGDAPAQGSNPQFQLVAQALDSRVEHRYLSVYALDPSEIGTFDFVHAADLLVHLERPLEALRRIRSVVADGGTFLLADAVEPEILGDAPLTWYVGGWQNVEWWLPSVTTLAQMVHDAGFDEVELLRLYNLPAFDDERGFWRAIIRARP